MRKLCPSLVADMMDGVELTRVKELLLVIYPPPTEVGFNCLTSVSYTDSSNFRFLIREYSPILSIKIAASCQNFFGMRGVKLQRVHPFLC